MRMVPSALLLLWALRYRLAKLTDLLLGLTLLLLHHMELLLLLLVVLLLLEVLEMRVEEQVSVDSAVMNDEAVDETDDDKPMLPTLPRREAPRPPPKSSAPWPGCMSNGRMFDEGCHEDMASVVGRRTCAGSVGAEVKQQPRGPGDVQSRGQVLDTTFNRSPRSKPTMGGGSSKSSSKGPPSLANFTSLTPPSSSSSASWTPDEKFRRDVINLLIPDSQRIHTPPPSQPPQDPNDPNPPPLPPPQPERIINQPLTDELIIHASLTTKAAAASVTRDALMQQIGLHLGAAGVSNGMPRTMMITGNAGQGKTSLLAKALTKAAPDLLAGGATLVLRHVGVTRATSSPLLLATSICEQLGGTTPDRPRAVPDSLINALAAGGKDGTGRIVVVLDGVDNLTNLVDRELRWLTPVLNSPRLSNTTFLITSTSSPTQPSELSIRRSCAHVTFLPVNPLPEGQDIAELDRVVKSSNLKTLTPTQRTLMLSTFKLARDDFFGVSPCLINLLIATYFSNSSSAMPEFLPASTPECIDVLLESLESYLDAALAPAKANRLLALITLAPDGLSPADVVALHPGKDLASIVAGHPGGSLLDNTTGAWRWSHRPTSDVAGYKYLAWRCDWDRTRPGAECRATVARHAGAYADLLKKRNEERCVEMLTALALAGKWEEFHAACTSALNVVAYARAVGGAVALADLLEQLGDVGGGEGVKGDQALDVRAVIAALRKQPALLGVIELGGVLEHVWLDLMRDGGRAGLISSAEAAREKMEKEGWGFVRARVGMDAAMQEGWVVVPASEDESSRVKRFEVSLDGREVIAVIGDNEIRSYDGATFKELWTTTSTSPILSLSLSPTSPIVALGTSTDARLHNSRTGLATALVAPPAGTPTGTHALTLKHLLFSDDGLHLMTSSRFGAVMRWELGVEGCKAVEAAVSGPEEGRRGHDAVEFGVVGTRAVWWECEENGRGVLASYEISAVGNRWEIKKGWRVKTSMSKDLRPRFTASQIVVQSAGRMTCHDAATGGAGWAVEVDKTGGIVNRWRVGFGGKVIAGDAYCSAEGGGLLVLGADGSLSRFAMDYAESTGVPFPISYTSGASVKSVTWCDAMSQMTVITDNPSAAQVLPKTSAGNTGALTYRSDTAILIASPTLTGHLIVVLATGRIQSIPSTPDQQPVSLTHPTPPVDAAIHMSSLIVLDRDGIVSSYALPLALPPTTDPPTPAAAWTARCAPDARILLCPAPITTHFHVVSVRGTVQRVSVTTKNVVAPLVADTDAFRDATLTCAATSTDGTACVMGESKGCVSVMPLTDGPTRNGVRIRDACSGGVKA
ncbi:hypothetical protein HK101_011128, partial [Irineochytrium annulatum]